MAEIRHQPDYHYTPSSAKSTRQLLDSTVQSSSSSSNEVPFRPQNVTCKSSNYAEAFARARAAVAEETHESKTEGGKLQCLTSEKESKGGAGSSNPSASWKPKYDRKQSWSQQDLKREMCVTGMAEAGKGYGFTEVGRDS